MIQKLTTIAALGIILFSSALPAIAETSSAITKETSTAKPLESTDTSSSQSSIPHATSNSITSSVVEGATSDNIASGTWGSCDWYITTTGVLHIGAGILGPGARVLSDIPWGPYLDKIFKVTIDDKVVLNENCENLFNNLFLVTEFEGLENFDTTNVTNMDGMFGAMMALQTLDLSSFDTTKVTTMKNMLSTGDALNKLILGPKIKINSDAGLWDLTENEKYTGKWQNIGTGTVTSPKGKNIWSSEDLMANYNDLNDADTYVWQPASVKAADVTVNYVDEDGKAITGVSAQTISGNVGEAYDASTATYKLTIDGYTLDDTQLPDNATGTLSATAQTVTYVYKNNAVKAADVTVNYVDEDGKAITGATSQTISGNVGETYDASTATYKLTIDGYTLDDTQLPDNATGTLSATAQTVTYVYKKTVTPAPPVKPTPPNIPNQPTKPTPSSSISSDSIPEVTAVTSPLPQTGDNKTLSIISMIFGLILVVGSLVFTLTKLRRRN